MDVAALDAALTTHRAARAARARARARIATSPARRRYWEQRSAPKTFEEKLTACGATAKACESCGAPVVRFCNAKLVCRGCGKRAWSKARRRIAAALDHRLTAALDRWRRSGRVAGEEPRLALVTLTVAHSGDVPADRELLSEAWHRWRAWYRQHYGQNLEYAWTPEYTPGRDDLGHVHLHVCTLLPWRDFRELHAAWVRATKGVGRNIHVSSRTRGVKRAAKYVAKYATKGVGELSTEHAAKWVAAQDGKRAISTSRGFYLPEEKYVCPDGQHTWDEWGDVAGWTPSYRRATAPLAGPAAGSVPHPEPRAGPVFVSEPPPPPPAQLALIP